MRRIRFATLLTLAALSAAPLLHAAVTMEWRGTIDEQANNVEGGRLNIDQMADAGLVTGAEGTHTRIDTLVIFMSSYFTGARQIPARTVVKDDAGQIVGVFASTEGTTQNSTAHGKKSLTLPLKGKNLLEGSGGNLILANDETYTIYFADEDNLEAPSDTQDTSGNNVLLMALHTTSSLAEALGVKETELAGLAAVNHDSYMVPFEFMGETVIVSPEGLSEAIAALPAAGGTVTLAGNVDASGVGAPIVLDKPVTLVGGGHTLTAPAKGPLFQVKADLTLNGVTIANENPAGHTIVVGDGTAALAEGAAGQTLTVTGETTIPGGIGVYEGQALTIAGAGTLTVTGAPGCAAIGGSHAIPACGDITLAMTGTLNADGGKDAASIGAGRTEAIAEPTGSITISSGTVNAKHDEMGGLGAAIGGGYNTAVAAIAITGGIVNAGESANVRPEKPKSTGTWVKDTWPTRLTAHVGGAAIGLGSRDPESAHNQVVATDISITGGKVNAYSRDCGSGIGGAYNASVASIEIGGSAKVYAVGSGGCAPIGGGYAGAGGQSIDINGSAEVIAEVLDYYWQDVEGDVRPEGTASGSGAAYEPSYTYSQAAIGGGYGGKAGTIVIGGSAKVLAIASTNVRKASNSTFYYWDGTYANATVTLGRLSQRFGGAGIGSGRFPVYAGEMDAERIVIQNTAQVYAYGGRRAAAIGGGYASNSPGLYRKVNGTNIYDIPQILPEEGGFPEIVIEGAPTIYAKGDDASAFAEGADIGGGMLMEAVGTVTISKEATLYLASGSGYYLGQGKVLDNVDVSFAYGQSVDMQSVPDGMEVPPPTRQTAATNIITLTGTFDADDRYSYRYEFVYYTNIYTIWATPLAGADITDDIVLRLSFAGKSGPAASKLLRVTDGGEDAEVEYEYTLKRNYFVEDALAEDSPVASIGDQSFVTLEDAFGAVEAGQTITLLTDLEQPSPNVITVDKAITLDGNNKTLSKFSRSSPHFALAAGGALTLKNLTLDANRAHAVIVENGSGANGDNAPTLTIEGKVTLKGGIGVYGDAELTITGTGALTANGYGSVRSNSANTYLGYAGIGGALVVYTGGALASYADTVCGDIVIAMAEGGSVTATSQAHAAAIGGGYCQLLVDSKEIPIRSGSVTIKSGTVTAYTVYGNSYAASIGSGANTALERIAIEGGTVVAGRKEALWTVADTDVLYGFSLGSSGDHDGKSGGAGGAGIGLARVKDVPQDTVVDTVISITGGDVTAYGVDCGAGIGGAWCVSPKSIAIGGTAKVHAVGQGGCAAIGGGNYGPGLDIDIDGTAEVIAEVNAPVRPDEGQWTTDKWGGKNPSPLPSPDDFGPQAAIGGGYSGESGDITIGGSAKVLAINSGAGTYSNWDHDYKTDIPVYKESFGGAAIGGGRIPGNKGTNQIVIQDNAQVYAYGGRTGAGIGGGHDTWIGSNDENGNPIRLGTYGNFSPISILDKAQVVAVGGAGASGIGGGLDAQTVNPIVIAHTASVTATPGAQAAKAYTVPDAIGSGSHNPKYNYANQHSPSDTHLGTSPELSLTVTGVTPAEDGSAMLPIVTKNAEATGYVNLTDAAGLTLDVTLGEGAEAQTFTVEETVGSVEGNLVSGLILDPEACIGSTPYATLEDAFAAAKENDTITLLKDIKRDAIAETITVTVPVTLEAEKNIYIELPGDAQVPYLTLNADLTLDGISLVGTERFVVHPIVVGKGKTVTLTVTGDNLVEGGIGVYDGTALTLAGAGTLEVQGHGPQTGTDVETLYGNAAIGGSKAHPACGDIVIAMAGGTLDASAMGNAAAIGNGFADDLRDAKGSVTIQSGTVTAAVTERRYYGAGIGGGRNTPIASITIADGTVTAGTKEWVADAGDDRQIAGPVGIGVSACGTTNGRLVDTSISITGGKVTAYGSAYMAAIGGGFRVSVKSIEIAGTAEVTAVTAGGAAAIGGGAYGAGGQAITIGGSAKVIAEALLYRKRGEQPGASTTTSIGPGAAIGGGYAGKSGTIVIEGNAQVLATNAGVGSYDYWGDGQYASVGTWTGDMTGITGGAAIGAGRIPSYPKDDMGSITIQGNAQVWAYGGRCNAGIGGGDGGWIDPTKPNQILGATPNFPPISILGTAKVVAKGGLAASGIGGGVNAQVGSLITIAYTADVKAWAGATAPNFTTPAAIGLGSYNVKYQYSPDQRPSTLAPATQPTTTLRVTDATAKDDGSLLLDIVTLDSAGLPEDLTDSPGLALQVEIGETLYAVSKTEGTTEHNKVEGARVENPVSGDSLNVARSGALLLPLEDTFYLADADGNVVARVDKVGDTTGTITKLDDALTLEPLSIYTKTGNLEEVTAAGAAAILGVEDHDHDTWVVTQAEDTLSSELAYVYDFGIAGLTIDKEQGTLTAVTVKMTEGVDCAPRNVTLAKATLTVYADGTPIATVPAPAFGEDGTLTVTLGEAYTIPETTTSTLSVSLSLLTKASAL